MFLCIACHDRKHPHCNCGKRFTFMKRCRHCLEKYPCADCGACQLKPKAVYFITKDYSFLGILNMTFRRIKANYPYVDGEFWLELDIGKYCEGTLALKKYPRSHVSTSVKGTVRELY